MADRLPRELLQFILTRFRERELLQLRILLSKSPNFWNYPNYKIDDDHFDNRDDRHLLGSCDGLLCVVSPRSPTQIVVLNPTTREVNHIQKLDGMIIHQGQHPGPVCWGFGYDNELVHDYYVMVGFRLDDARTCFYALTLRLNKWVCIGTTKHTTVSRVGVFYKQSLHWVAKHGNDKEILSARVKGIAEIRQPDHMEYRTGLYRSKLMWLGISEGRLCLFRRFVHVFEIWMMNMYNVKQSWSNLRYRYPHPVTFDILHYLKPLERYIPNKEPFCHAYSPRFLSLDYIKAPMYVPSLVSPNAKSCYRQC